MTEKPRRRPLRASDHWRKPDHLQALRDAAHSVYEGGTLLASLDKACEAMATQEDIDAALDLVEPLRDVLLLEAKAALDEDHRVRQWLSDRTGTGAVRRPGETLN